VKGQAMDELVTDDDLARARNDPDFRQQLLAHNLDRLLEALNKMRKSGVNKPDSARQIREGVDLAVKLADRLQQNVRASGPQAA
jgi:hypothetical protein